MVTPEADAKTAELDALPDATTSPDQADNSDGDKADDSSSTDFEARVKELEETNRNLESDLKSIEGRARKGDDVSRAVTALRDEVAGMREAHLTVMGGLSTALVSGDSTGLPETIEGANKAARTRQIESTFNAGYQALRDKMGELIEDAPDEAARWNEQARLQGDRSVADRDLGSFYSIYADAVTSTAAKARETLKAENAELKKQQGEIRRKVEEDLEVHDLGSSGSTASSGQTITVENIDNLMSRVDEFDVKKQAEIRDKYRTLIMTGKFS